MVAQLEAPLKLHGHHSIIVLSGLRVPSIGPPLYRETSLSRTADVCFCQSKIIIGNWSKLNIMCGFRGFLLKKINRLMTSLALGIMGEQLRALLKPLIMKLLS